MTPLAQHHQFPSEPGLHELDSDLEHLRFALARVSGGEALALASEDEEMLVVVLAAPSGIRAVADGREFQLPPRHSVFADEPSAVYVPPRSKLRLEGELLAGVFRASADADEIVGLQPYAILPKDVSSVVRGQDNFTRRVRDILPADRPALRLLAGETLNPPGNWSSSPPHKHDREIPGEEAELDEIYVFRVEPAQGFGLQLSYSTDPLRETSFVVRDLDVVSIPAGYHPVVAGPGYSLYYLWCLAGRGRELLWNPDPAHAWVDGSSAAPTTSA